MRRSPEPFATDGNVSRPTVALVIDRTDWHAPQIANALAARRLAMIPMRLHLCAFSTQSPTGLWLDGFGECLPDAVLVRSLSGGTFEAVTLRLGILHALRERGVAVWNDARAIERCVDKSTTSFLLSRAGIATPPTWATQSYEQARAIVQREIAHGPLVLKPLFGSQGRGLRLISRPDELPPAETVPGGVWYLQRFVGVEGEVFHDFRLFVVRGRVIAAMQRRSTHWITNVKRGGRPVAAVVSDAMKSLAVDAAAAVGADFAGVDILHAVDQRPTVLEVNSMPAWSGLQKVTSANIAGVLADALITALAARTARGAMA